MLELSFNFDELFSAESSMEGVISSGSYTVLVSFLVG
jgi:hypothetical protein